MKLLFWGTIRALVAIAFTGLALPAAGQSSRADTLPLRDGWESDEHRADQSSCHQVDDALVVPVLLGKRGEAITRLEKVSALELNESNAAAFTQEWSPKSNEFVTAKRLVASQIALLEEREDVVMAKRVGSFSPRDKVRLESLRKLKHDPTLTGFVPYLARAVAKNQSTGGFCVAQCADDLWVNQTSLGVRVPPSTRAPIVVFWGRPPVQVHVGWSMAR